MNAENRPDAHLTSSDLNPQISTGCYLPRRRTLVIGAAWTAPVILAGAVVPAASASSCAVPVTLPVSGPTWQVTSTNMKPRSADGIKDGGYLLAADPASNAAASLSVTSNLGSFVSGRIYALSIDITAVISKNPRDFDFSILVNGQTVPGLSYSSGSVAPVGTVRLTGSYTPTVTISTAVVLGFSFAAGTSTVGDDMTVANFALSCSG